MYFEPVEGGAFVVLYSDVIGAGGFESIIFGIDCCDSVVLNNCDTFEPLVVVFGKNCIVSDATGKLVVDVNDAIFALFAAIASVIDTFATDVDKSVTTFCANGLSVLNVFAKGGTYGIVCSTFNCGC